MSVASVRLKKAPYDNASHRRRYWMPQPTHLFDDVWQLAAHVETSRDSQGKWITYPGLNNSLLHTTSWAGRRLDRMLEQTRQMTDPVLQQRAQQIAELTDGLTLALPQGQIPRRKPRWERQGSRLSLGRILQGSNTPWRQFVKEPVPGGKPLYLLALCTSYSGGTDDQTILWTMVASLALVDALIRQGARVELWDCTMNPDTYNAGNTWVTTLTRLYTSSQAWNLQDVVLATDKAWFRRLQFRLWEMGQTSTRQLESSYGSVARPHQMESWLGSWAQDVHPEARLLLGAHTTQDIDNASTARRWVEKQLAQLSEAA